jgi:hypothetical protein
MNGRDRQGCLNANFNSNVENIINLQLMYDKIPPREIYLMYMKNFRELIEEGRDLYCGFTTILAHTKTGNDLEAISLGSESLKSELVYQD